MDQLFDSSNCFGSLAFELGSMRKFMDVDGGVNGNLWEALSFLLLHHNHDFIIILNIQLFAHQSTNQPLAYFSYLSASYFS